jgi:hypothetical protein
LSHPEQVTDEELDPAKAALARARATSRSAPASTNSKQAKSNQSSPSRNSGNNSDFGRDPVLLGAALDGVVADHGWGRPTSIAAVTGRWAEIVGPEIADHVVIEGFDAEAASLVLRTDSTAWATQMRLLVPTVLARLADEVGSGVVTAISINGPTQPSWIKGRRTAPGRGPRDTYG